MTNYQGGASTSPLNMLKSLPQSIVKCYAQFWDYFFGDTVRHNVLQSFGVLYALAFLVVGAALVRAVGSCSAQKGCETAFYAVAAVLVMPLASVIFLLAASQATFYIPMAGGTALFFPVCFWLLDSARPASNTETSGKNKAGKVEKAALLLAAAGILYGSVFMSAIDQQAMYEGRKATKQIADLVAGELVAEGYYDLPEKLPVMLVAAPVQARCSGHTSSIGMRTTTHRWAFSKKKMPPQCAIHGMRCFVTSHRCSWSCAVMRYMTN